MAYSKLSVEEAHVKLNRFFLENPDSVEQVKAEVVNTVASMGSSILVNAGLKGNDRAVADISMLGMCSALLGFMLGQEITQYKEEKNRAGNG